MIGPVKEEKPFTLWPGLYHSPVTAALWHARSSFVERTTNLPLDGPAQTKLLHKTPEQNRTNVQYHFATDSLLREQYRNPWNSIRIGKLLEDLDALAGTIAMKHCADDDFTTRPLLLVTASVDKISMKKPLRLDTDLKLAGVVAWVGHSSMEIRMEVIQPVRGISGRLLEYIPRRATSWILLGEVEFLTKNTHHLDLKLMGEYIRLARTELIEKDDIALIANFTFVARDCKTRKAAPVNHLSPQTDEEKHLYALGEARDAHRKKQRMQQQKQPLAYMSSTQDNERLSKLLTEGRVLCEMPALADRNSILIKDTRLENAIICQPQQRNMHGRIFGGFLMRRAFEIAFSTCYVFGGIRPLFLEVDHVDFRRPVDVGDLLRFKSCVLYTESEGVEQPLIHVEVVAHVTQPEIRSSEVSNTFYFTFSLDPECLKSGAETQVRKVVPGSEEEARGCLARYDADHLVHHPLLQH